MQCGKGVTYLVRELRSCVASVMSDATIGREEEKKPAMQRAAKNIAKLTERPLARKPAQSPKIDRRIMLRRPTRSLREAQKMVPMPAEKPDTDMRMPSCVTLWLKYSTTM